MEKYPRTFHFQVSPGKGDDDKVVHMRDLGNFLQDEIVITEKLDGGNSCWKGHQGIFARSHALPTKEPWFDHMKGLYYSKMGLLDPNKWIFGENTYAIHSIEYTEMEHYFYMFGLYEDGVFASWDDTEAEAKRLDIPTAPVLFRGEIESIGWLAKWFEREIKKPSILGGDREGFVVRVVSPIHRDEFHQKVGKYVREGHVQTDEHWTKNWKPQTLKGK